MANILIFFFEKTATTKKKTLVKNIRKYIFINEKIVSTNIYI